MPGLVKEMLQRFVARQAHFFDKLPKAAKEKFAEMEDKFAELRVTGPEGGVFYLQYKGQRFLPLDERPDVPYEKIDKLLLDGDMINYAGGDEVLFDIIDREISPRAVIAHRYFRANTQRVIYDTEEFAQAFEQFLDEMSTVLGGGK